MTKLKKGDHPAKTLAAALASSPSQPPDDKLLHNWLGSPIDRTLMFTALGLRYPQKQAEYFAAARPLNFGHQFPSRMVAQVLSGNANARGGGGGPKL